MSSKLVLCIPGTWSDRTDFLQRVVAYDPNGRYVFAGKILVDGEANDHVPLELFAADPNTPRAFEIAGQGRIPADVLGRLRSHTILAFLHFPADLFDQRERVLKYTQMMQRLGGIGIKVESAGVAHSWERWFALLSGIPFQVYSSAVALIGDKDYYFSCGMHNFGLPECEAPCSVPNAEAARLMNQFNIWQIVEKPTLATGHTFSITAEAPRFRLSLQTDYRHEKEHLFYNPHGVWRLDHV